MFRVSRSASMPVVRLTCLALCFALVLSSVSFAVIGKGKKKPGGNSVSSSAAQRTQGPPSPNLPNLNEARRIKPGPPKAPNPVPATKCRRRDTVCKNRHGEVTINQPQNSNDRPDRLVARVDNHSRRNRFTTSEKAAGRGLSIPAVDALLDKPNRPMLDSAVGRSHRPNRNGAGLKTAPATAPGFTVQAPSEWVLAVLDPKNRKGTPGEDLLSRNFNWSLPLLSLPGRAGLDLGLTLSLNSLLWTKAGSSIHFDVDYGFPAPGFWLGFPSLQQYYLDPQTGSWTYQMIMPSGRRVEFRQVSTNVYEAPDSSYLQLTYNPSNYSFTLRTTDGLQLKFEFQLIYYSCTEIKDRNGNFITITYNDFGSGQEINTITDTLGRVITFNYDSYGQLNSITQTWGGQTHTWATFAYGTQTIQTNFDAGLTMSGASNGSVISVLKRVGLDDGSVYSFEYNTYCQVKTIRRYAPNTSNPVTFPNDYFQRAYTTYNLPDNTGPSQTDCPRFTTRTDWAYEWNGGVTFTYGPATPTWAYGEVTTPDGTLHKEFFATSGWQRGLTTQTETWSGGVKKKWTTLQWTQDNTGISYLLNPRVTETNVYDDASNRRRTTISYSAGYGLPSDVYEYDANATTLLRRTHTDYVSGAYITMRIIGLPSARMLYDGSNNLASKIEYFYDESGFVGPDRLLQTPPVQPPATAVVQHDGANYGNWQDGSCSTCIHERGNLTTVRRYNVDGSTYVETRTGYHTTGSPYFTNDPLGHKTKISYADSFSDGGNQRNTFAYPTTMTDADNFSSTIQYNFDFGAVTRTQDPKGAIFIREYDTAGRLTKVTNKTPGHPAYDAHTEYVYAPNQYYVQSFTTINDLVLNNRFYSITVFDGHDRVRATASDHPTSAGQNKAQYNVYDVMGRLTQQSNPTEINAYWSPYGDDAAGWVWSYQAYDWQGRPTVSNDQEGKTKEVLYGGCGCAGGQMVVTRDEVGRRQKLIYDVLGRLKTAQTLFIQPKEQPLNGDGAVYSTTTNTYNVRDQITNINVKDEATAVSQNTQLVYDGHGRLKERWLPIYLGNPQSATPYDSYEYYADDTLMKVTDPRGASATYGYNNRHLVTSVTYGVPSGVAPTSNVTFGYDSAGNRTSMVDGLGNVTYDYDTLSQMNWERRYFNDLGQNYTISYEYNLAGGVKKITDPWNASITYAYNKAGEVTTITGVGYADINQWTNRTVSQFASNVTYRAWGAIKSFTNGNFATEKTNFSLNYDTRLQMTRFDGGGRATDHTYYNDSRVKDITDSTWSSFNPRTYNYDHAGRLTSATAGTGSPRPYSLNYAQDVWGNATSRTGSHWSSTLTPYTPTYSSNRSVGSTGWTYDVAGNVTDTSGPNVNPPAMKYDAEGRLASVITATGLGYLTEHGYDGDGQRVRYSSDFLSGYPATATTYHHLRSSVLGGAVIAEVIIKRLSDPDEVSSNSYIYLNGERIAYQKNAHQSGANKEVVWIYRNPVINTNYEHNRLNINGQPTDWWTELVTDPTGSLVTTYDPGSLPQVPLPTIGPPEVGAINDFGDCYLDGVRSSCGITLWLLSRGWAAEVPWGETGFFWDSDAQVWQSHSGFVIDWDSGYYGFVPIGAKYGGDGSWGWVDSKKGRPALKPKGKAKAGQDDNKQGKFQKIGWFTGTITDDMYNYVTTYYIDPFYDPCASSYTGNPLPGKEQATLALAAAALNPDFAAKISGIWARESFLALTPDGDAGPAQLTTWWSRNHPELIVGNAYGSWKGRTTTPFDGSVRDNIATLRNIVYYSHNRYQGSYYQTAYWYGPGDPNNPKNAPANRKQYAKETVGYYNMFKSFFDCLERMGRP